MSNPKKKSKLEVNKFIFTPSNSQKGKVSLIIDPPLKNIRSIYLNTGEIKDYFILKIITLLMDDSFYPNCLAPFLQNPTFKFENMRDFISWFLLLYYLVYIKNASIRTFLEPVIRNQRTIWEQIIENVRIHYRSFDQFRNMVETREQTFKTVDFMKDDLDEFKDYISSRKKSPKFLENILSTQTTTPKSSTASPTILKSPDPIASPRQKCSDEKFLASFSKKDQKDWIYLDVINCLERLLLTPGHRKTLQTFLKDHIDRIETLNLLQNIQKDLQVGIPQEQQWRGKILGLIQQRKKQLKQASRIFKEMKELGLLKEFLEHTPQKQLRNLDFEDQTDLYNFHLGQIKNNQQYKAKQINQYLETKQGERFYKQKDNGVFQMKKIPIDKNNSKEMKQFFQAVKTGIKKTKKGQKIQ